MKEKILKIIGDGSLDKPIPNKSENEIAEEITAHVFKFMQWYIETEDKELPVYLKNDEELVIDFEQLYKEWLNDINNNHKI